MEKVSVCINGNGFETDFFGCFDCQKKVRVKGGFSAKINEIRRGGFILKKGEPGCYCFDIKGFCPMLFLINITMGTGKVAFCQDVEKEVGRVL